jgi:hypothetical protein
MTTILSPFYVYIYNSTIYIVSVELQSSLLNLGLGIGFIPGILYDKFGPFWTSVAGLFVSVGSYMLLWSTTKYVPFYRSNSWLMSIYFLLCGMYIENWLILIIT